MIDRFLTTLRYVGLVRISGQFHEVGGPPPGRDEPLPAQDRLEPDDGGLAITLQAVDGEYAGTAAGHVHDHRTKSPASRVPYA